MAPNVQRRRMLPDTAILGGGVLRQALHTLVHIGVAAWGRPKPGESGLPTGEVCLRRAARDSELGVMENECERGLSPLVWWVQALLFLLGVAVGALICLVCQQFRGDRRRAARAPPRHGHGVVVASDSW